MMALFMVNWQKCRFTASSEALCQTACYLLPPYWCLWLTQPCAMLPQVLTEQGARVGHLGGIWVRTAEHISDVATLKLISPRDIIKAVKFLETELTEQTVTDANLFSER